MMRLKGPLIAGPHVLDCCFQMPGGGIGGYFEVFVIIYHHMPQWKHQLGIKKKRNNQLLLPFLVFVD